MLENTKRRRILLGKLSPITIDQKQIDIQIPDRSGHGREPPKLLLHVLQQLNVQHVLQPAEPGARTSYRNAEIVEKLTIDGRPGTRQRRKHRLVGSPEQFRCRGPAGHRRLEVQCHARVVTARINVQRSRKHFELIGRGAGTRHGVQKRLLDGFSGPLEPLERNHPNQCRSLGFTLRMIYPARHGSEASNGFLQAVEHSKSVSLTAHREHIAEGADADHLAQGNRCRRQIVRTTRDALDRRAFSVRHIERVPL